MPEIHSLDEIRAIPNINIEKNYQQVLAIAKQKMLEKLCIFMDAWNCDDVFDGSRGQPVAETIHTINKDIPILIWDGREYISDENVPAVFKVSGELKPITNDNELYLSFDYYEKNQIYTITKKFFENTLSAEDVPHKECLKWSFG